MLADSSRYLTLLDEIREQLTEALEAAESSEAADSIQQDLQSFFYLITVWRLCQIVFLEHMEGMFEAF